MQNSIGMSLKGDGKSSPFGDLKDSSFKNKGDKQISKLKKILAKSS